MTQQADLFRNIDTLPPKYISEVVAFVGYLQHKAQQAAAQQAAAQFVADEAEREKEALDNAASYSKPKIHIPVNSEGKFILTKEIIDEMMQDSLLKKLTGILHTDMTLDEIRMERLAKHL